MNKIFYLLGLQLLACWSTWGLAAERPASAKTPADPQRPNVVLILIDDLSHYGVTAYGANRISDKAKGTFTNVRFETPSIDQIAKAGLKCDYAYAYPLCEATRIALMSGQYNSRNYLKPKAQHRSEITFGDAFKKAGYATGIFGKWKQTRGTKKIPGKDYIFEFGWDQFCCFDVDTEGQRFINPHLIINGQRANYKNRQDVDPQTGRRWYGPDICNRYALQFIEENKDRPFFLYYPMLLVHDEHKPTPDTQPHSKFDNCDESQKNDDFGYFPDMLAYMDKLIGKVTAKLDEHGLRENTLVVVMGDNGTKEPFTHVLPDGSTFQGNKGATKTNGLQVPLVFLWPQKIPAGDGSFRNYEGMVDIVDVYPTIADAAGVEIPNRNQIDGVSFWDQVRGVKTDAHRDFIYTWYNANYSADDLSNVVRYAFDKQFKRYAPHKNFPQGRFFDLRSDPFEDLGQQKIMLPFDHFYKEGMDLTTLDPVQQAAFDRLGKILDANRYVPVEAVRIHPKITTLKPGQTIQLDHAILPQSATRKNIIWHSSNPQVAQVDKFGELKGLAPGTVTVSLYSWHDASPLAAGQKDEFSQSGVADQITIKVEE